MANLIHQPLTLEIAFVDARVKAFFPVLCLNRVL